MTPEVLRIGDAPLSLAELQGVYRRPCRVELTPSALSRLDDSAAVVDRVVARGGAVYGVNTGFGLLAHTRIADCDLQTLQRNLVLSHSCGVGAPLSDDLVRLIVVLKIAGLARGASGVRREVVQRLIDLLDRGVTPEIPGKGSVGASGDLAPLAHLAAVLIGEGRAWVDGERLEGRQALQRVGLTPLVLGPKEGLALLNGTQVSTALALAGLFEAGTVFASALVTGGLATDALKGSDAPFDPRIHAVRGQHGQIEVAAALRTLLQGSAIRASHRHACDKVQDPYSFRCQPQVMGACLDSLRGAARTLAIEANAVTDNPLVFAETDEVLSGGNFHAEPVGFAAEQIALALCEIGSLSERRTAVLIDPKMSGLPAFLTPDSGLNSGFMIAQVTAAALVSENKSLAWPPVVDTIPTSAGQEDHVSMATHAARRLAVMADNARGVVAVELLAAVQGLEFHRPLRSSEPLEQAVEQLRAVAAPVLRDREFAPLIASAADIVASGALGDLVEGARVW